MRSLKIGREGNRRHLIVGEAGEGTGGKKRDIVDEQKVKGGVASFLDEKVLRPNALHRRHAAGPGLKGKPASIPILGAGALPLAGIRREARLRLPQLHLDHGKPLPGSVIEDEPGDVLRRGIDIQNVDAFAETT